MRIKKLAALFVAAIVIGAGTVHPVRAAEQTTPAQQHIVITEIQTGSAISANQEFVELYNQTDAAITLTGWRLEYKSATGTTWSTKATLAGFIEPHSFYVISTTGYLEEAGSVLSGGLAAAGGHLRLVQIGENTSLAVDLVGWGTADSAEGGQPAPAPEPSQSAQRCFAD